MAVKEPAAARRRMTINDVRDDDDHSLFVYNRGINIYKKPVQILLPHAPVRGRSIEIHIPMTFIPIDLSTYAPKDELINNSELYRMLNLRLLELVHPDEARAVLSLPESVAEIERLDAVNRAALASSADSMKQDEDFRAVAPQVALQQGAAGELDLSTNGVSPSVVDAMSSDDGHRVSLLRNLQPLMSSRDKQYVREHSSDPVVRRIVGEV